MPAVPIRYNADDTPAADQELRAKLVSLDETRKTAERELAILKDHREHIAELEWDKEAVLEH